MAARMSPPSDHLVSVRSKVVIAALRSSGDRTSGGSALASEPTEDGGPVKAPMMRPVKVCGGLLLPSPAVGDMAPSGYRRRWGTPNHPVAAEAPPTQATVVVRRIRQGA